MEEISKAIERFLSVSSGYGYGDGSGYGYGSGSGYGYGDGSGSGSGSGLVSFAGQKVYYIDGIATVIEKVKGNLAKGYTVNADLTTSPCYVANGHDLFAHGESAAKAQEALQEKIFANMDTDEAIEAFISEFVPGKKYPARDFYVWHNRLTGSCEFGRNKFVREHGIDLENGTYTVEEFIEITKDDFGGDVIRQIKERLEA